MSLAQKNLETFVQIANSIEFERSLGPLIQYLCSTDYFIAPASMGGNHDGIPGGLFNHCLRMYEALIALNKLIDNKYTKETLFLVAFCHDLCKVNIYKPKEKWHKEGRDWVSTPGYEIVDDFPLGHGEKSLHIAYKYIELTKDEMLAIRHHMGAFCVGNIICPTERWSFNRAQELCPLVWLANAADQTAVAMSAVQGINQEKGK